MLEDGAEMVKKYSKAGAAIVFLLLFDQYTKYLAVLHLKGQAAIPLIKGIFELRYLENPGAAFGSFQGKQVMLLTITFIAMLAMMYVYGKIPDGKRFLPLKITDVLLLAGAAGNMIDRIRQQYVVDFLYFKAIDFPIFNIADCYVTIAAVLLIILVLFVYKDEELQFLSNENKEYHETRN
ncbi:MAG: signal peptidase II [Lachnospiraceae bacterium]|nr:signal peptidase II [Lachnospiraceae bacterium]